MVSRTSMADRPRRHMASGVERSFQAEYESPQMAVTIMADIEENPDILNIIDLTKYSTPIRVVRVTSLLVLFARKWKTPGVYNDNILTTKNEISYLNSKNLPSYDNSALILTMKAYFAMWEVTVHRSTPRYKVFHPYAYP